ncbi:MAG TPA: RluA family pseudouridine synthase [bacterium]|nr:RluA family pseudouridine synthase [bacterium]
MTPEVHVVDAPALGGRLDRLLAEALPFLSRSRIQQLIRAGEVQVNGVVARKAGMRLEGGENLLVALPQPQPAGLEPEAVPLEILYEDERVLAVNKPAGVVVHPSAGHERGTLVHAVLGHCPDLPGVGGLARPGVVHRLDRDTSGVILFAKDDQAHRSLQEAFRSREVEKVYLAIVDGHPPTPKGRIEAAVGRDPRSRVRMAIRPVGKGRAATTVYTVLETFREHSFVEVRPVTGRTHQIRVHLSFLGCPVTGDTTYGRKRATLPVDRQLLHAWKLSLRLPGAEKRTTLTAPLPADFEETLAALRASTPVREGGRPMGKKR